MNGILVINKDAGLTSHDVVFRLRKLLKTKKIGHAGTLDPLAKGVLVVGVGKGTKLLQFLSADRKAYKAKLFLGTATTTYDKEGEVTASKPYQHDLTIEMIQKVFESFKGTSMQYPPIYSAIKKNGRPLYEYARNGENIEVEPREITIECLNLLSFSGQVIEFECVVSKGTYIRSLCVDIANALGYPGHMADLVRTQAGVFSLEEAITLEEIEAGNHQLISMDEGLKGMPSFVIEDEHIVYYGKKIKSEINHPVAIYNTDGHLLAVYGPDGHGYLKSIRGLW